MLICFIASFTVDNNPNVFAEDSSNCTKMSGFLIRVDVYGAMQKRYVFFNNEFLVYQMEVNSTKIKGAIDLSNVNSTVNGFKILLTAVSGQTGTKNEELHAEDNKTALKWLKVINERKKWILGKLSTVDVNLDDIRTSQTFSEEITVSSGNITAASVSIVASVSPTEGRTKVLYNLCF